MIGNDTMCKRHTIREKISEFPEKVTASGVKPSPASVWTGRRHRKMQLYLLYSASANFARVDLDIGKRTITPSDYYVSPDGECVAAIRGKIRRMRLTDVTKNWPVIKFMRQLYVKADEYYLIDYDSFENALMRSWQLIADCKDNPFGDADAEVIGAKLIEDAAKCSHRLDVNDIRKGALYEISRNNT
jgi:hypothetical protein